MLPPLVVIGLRLASFGSARAFRKWYRALNKEQRRAFARRWWRRAPFIAAGGVGGMGAFYTTHLEETPVTHRSRFMFNSRATEVKISTDAATTLIKNYGKTNIVDPGSEVHERIADIKDRLLTALSQHFSADFDAQFLGTMNWKLHVVKLKDENAFVLPDGNIFVFTGMIDKLTKGNSREEADAELAMVIGHEISHALMRHGGEKMSKGNVLVLMQLGFSFCLWAMMPDGVLDAMGSGMFRFVLGVESLQEYFLSLFTQLPNSRQMETEADHVGLLLASAACYDPSAAPRVWEKMRTSKIEAQGHADGAVAEFFSTHPNNTHRIEDMTRRLPEAAEKWESCDCGRLPSGCAAALRAAGQKPGPSALAAGA